MDIRKLKFHRNGDSYALESKQSVLTAFRHHINLAQLSGFSSIDTKAHPEEYTPMMYTFRKDLLGREIYEDDVVFAEVPDVFSLGRTIWKVCIAGFSEEHSAFGLFDSKNEFETLQFIPFYELGKVSMFRIANWRYEHNKIEEFTDIIDNPEDVKNFFLVK